MRTKTLASLLILCGSTAAFAQITTAPQDQTMANNMTANNSADSLDNLATPNASDTAPGNSGDDAPPQD